MIVVLQVLPEEVAEGEEGPRSAPGHQRGNEQLIAMALWCFLDSVMRLLGCTIWHRSREWRGREGSESRLGQLMLPCVCRSKENEEKKMLLVSEGCDSVQSVHTAEWILCIIGRVVIESVVCSALLHARAAVQASVNVALQTESREVRVDVVVVMQLE